MLAGKSNYQNRMTKMKNKEMSKEKLGQLVMQGLQGRGIKEGMGSHSRKDRGLEEKNWKLFVGGCMIHLLSFVVCVSIYLGSHSR